MKTSTKYITKIAVLSAIAAVMMFIETPLPLMPPFLKLDLSDIPALVGGFALGPVAGILVELVKNLIHVTMSQTGGAGELANFIVGVCFVVPAGVVYKYHKSFIGAIAGLAIGGTFMALSSCAVNYYITIPFYVNAGFPLDGIIEWCASVNSNINSLRSLILMGILPFNIIKVIIVSIVTVLIYKRLSLLLHK